MAYIGLTSTPIKSHGTNATIIERARALRKNMTKEEKKLWERIRRKQINGVRFRKQHPIGNFIADFYCHEYQLIIEVDGGYHLQRKDYDSMRTKIINDYGITVIRFSNKEVITDIEKVLKQIKTVIHSLSPLGGIRRG